MVIDEVVMLRLARELAMDLSNLPETLTKLGVDADQWQRMQANPRFQAVLKEMIEAWHAAANAPERVKLKSAAMLEEALEEIQSRIHDNREPLAAKTELLKLVSRLAGIGNEKVEGQVSEKFVLSINIGDGAKHGLGIVTSKVIEHQS